MKNFLAVTFALVMLAGVACAATTANNSLAPLATATSPATNQHVALRPNEGSPIPVCQPGHNCPPQLMANEGSPIPVCQPGHNCPPLSSLAMELI